jgi:hypothetical protein
VEHKVRHIPLETHSVCPLVRIGTLPPPSRVPPGTKGGTLSAAGEGEGGPNSDDWRKSLALCLLCAVEAVNDVAYRLSKELLATFSF